MNSLKVRQAFEAFDLEQRGVIAVADFPSAVRVAGCFPSQAIVRSLLNEISDGTTIDFFKFSELCKECATRAQIDQDGIAQALSLLDTEKDGKIVASQLKELMTTQGEAMSAEEVDNILQRVPQDAAGKIAIADLMSSLFDSDL